MRQFINHTDRFVWLCRRENLERYVDNLERLTGASFHGPWLDDAIGAHICVSNRAGLQVMAPVPGHPTAAALALCHTLDVQGEGAFAVVFGVPDIGLASARMRSAISVSAGLISRAAGAPWDAEIEKLLPGAACRVMNTTFIFAEISYPDSLFSTEGSLPGTTRNNDHLDHVAWLSLPETHDSNVKLLSDLGGTPLDGPYDIPQVGLRVALSWETGLEVVAPLPDSDKPEAVRTREILERKGEGLYAVLFGVSDLPAAVSRAQAEGYTVGKLIRGGDPKAPWAGKFLNFHEISIGEVANTSVMFCTVDYSEGIFVTHHQTDDAFHAPG